METCAVSKSCLWKIHSTSKNKYLQHYFEVDAAVKSTVHARNSICGSEAARQTPAGGVVFFNMYMHGCGSKDAQTLQSADKHKYTGYANTFILSHYWTGSES